MKVAVVVLNYNGRTLLETYLHSIWLYRQCAEVWVIDNHSEDDSIDFIKTHYPGIHIVSLTQNHHYAKGYNIGLQSINADVYCLINSDVRVSEHWLDAPLALLDSNPTIGVVQPKILDDKNPDQFEYAGAAGGFLDLLGYPYCDGRRLHHIERDHGQYPVAKSIGWASGACFFIRSNVFWQAGGFDESFEAHMEEIDLCWRISLLNHGIWYTPDSHVYHLGGATLSHSNPHKTFLNFRNSLLMLTKNLPWMGLFPIILIRLCLDGMLGLILWKTEGFNHLSAVFRAHIGYYQLFISSYKKRKDSPHKNWRYFKRWSVFIP